MEPQNDTTFSLQSPDAAALGRDLNPGYLRGHVQDRDSLQEVNSDAQRMANAGPDFVHLIIAQNANVIDAFPAGVLALIQQFQPVEGYAHHHVRLHPHARAVIREWQGRIEFQHTVVALHRLRFSGAEGHNGAKLFTSG